jgi:hypothetical protein
VFVVAASGAAVFLAMHFVLGFSLGTDGAAVHPRQRPLGWILHDRVWRRIAAIDHLNRTGQLAPDTRLGVFIGVSTTATGILRQFLDGRATAADRWIVLPGAGLSFENIESVMLPVFFCSVKPTTVVFGVHPQMLVGERYIENEQAFSLQRVVGRRRRLLESRFAGFRALKWLRKHWAVRHRAIAADFLRARIYTLRLLVFYWAGVSAEDLFEPSAQPWDEDPLWLWNLDDVQNQFAHDQIEFWTRRGHFKAENYDPDGAQARSFVRMIRAYRKLGAKVYVVILPMRSTLRRLVPSNAKPCLIDVLHRAFPEAPPTVIDVETAMPDELFTDEAHLSKAGAERLSKLVAGKLQAPPASAPVPDGP